MKHTHIPLLVSVILQFGNSVISASAAVPLRWTVETSAANPATFDQFAGATYDLEATLQSRSKPLAVSGDPQLFWQTNGMGSAWWTAPATVSGNVLRATWTPACDVGARVYNCFIGITGTVYNAAFQLRLRPSPGAIPNELPIPTPVIDFAKVTVLNPPWPSGSARPLPRYLHYLEFDDTYPDDAAWYYAQPQDYGGCSAVREGGFLFRNYDWRFDDAAEFIVRVSAGPAIEQSNNPNNRTIRHRFASIGVANCGTNLTETFVTSGKPSRYYKCLPGRTVDGINENGVVCEVNVVDGEPQWRSGVLTASDIHPLAAVRWALDNGTSAGMVASNLSARIKFPTGWTQNFHWMVADAAQTWIVENGAAHLVDATSSSRPVMTNFRLYPSRDTTGAGQERYNLLVGGGPITNAWFTRAYSRSTVPEWESEFKDASEMEAAMSAWETHTREELRGKGLWQTVHCSIYDITNRILRISVQEQPDWYTFSIPAFDEGKVREIVQPMIDAATGEVYRVNEKWVCASDPDVRVVSARWNEGNIWSVYLQSGSGLSDYIYPTGPEDATELTGYSPIFGGDVTIEKKKTTPVLAEKLGLVTTNSLNKAFTTNNSAFVSAVRDVSDTQYRPFGDEYVYEPSGYTDFTWHGDRQDAIEAIGSRQPEIIQEYGDNYVEWAVDFYMGDQFYYGYSYAEKSSPSVPFDFYVDYYDPDTGEWIYDYFTLTAVRTISGWKRADPIDTFAHQGALTHAMRSFNAMSNTLYTGESKVMRTGEPNQYGSGWGYYRRPLGSDFRSWRIRIPRSNVSGMSGSASAHVNPFYDFFGNRHDHYNLANPLDSLPDYWKIGRKLVHTDGAYGQESVEQFDMDVGLVRRSTESEDAGYYVNFRVKCISADPRVFETTPLLSTSWHETSEWTNGTTRTMMCRPVDLPHVTGPRAYYESNYGYCHVDMSSFYVDPTPVVSTNSVLLTFFIRDEKDKRTNSQNPSYSNETKYYEVSNVVRRVDVTLNYTAESQLEDFILQAGRVLTDDVSNLYYDPAADCTYRISVSNGCFYSEWNSPGDWRKNGL